ncbi:MAG TPA: response regulator [Noviherbaspirillum sp.]|nr:response regulator [Noviherbaspirillum sp.]
MRIRTRLLLLVLAILLPASLCAVVALAYAYHETQDFQRQAMRETARALSLGLERELARRESILHALAASPALDNDDFRNFYAHAKQIADAGDVAIFLSTSDGRQLLNTRVPYGKPLPRMLPQALEMRAEAGPRATLISNLYEPPVGKGYSFAIQIPVERNGRVRYYLNMGSYAAQLQSLLELQRLPPEWIAGIADAHGVIVARNRDAERYVGVSVRRTVGHLLEAGEGFAEGRALSGEAATVFLSHAPHYGWNFYVAVPTDLLQRAAWRTNAWLALAMLLLLGLALLAALKMARDTAGAIEATRRAAQRLGERRPVRVQPSGLVELDTVNAALAEAGTSLQAAHEDQERRIADAVASAERSQRALLHAQKLEALGRLTGGIAHDFNNILQTVSTGVELTRRLTTDARALGTLDNCARAVRRAAELTRQLAVFGRRQDSRIETIDPVRHLTEVRPLLAGGLRSDIELNVDIPTSLWHITVDPLQFELALLNLTMNARDAMPAGGKLRLCAHNETLTVPLDELQPGDYVRISLLDNGEGMTPEVLARAIDPFFTTKGVGQGTGMGLSQAYGFARQSGGTLLLQSQSGKGTDAILYLPRALQMPITPAVAGSGGSKRRADGERVLLVDDDAQVREVVRAALESRGFSVLEAEDGDEAIRMLQSGIAVDAVLSDIVMPGSLSGIDLAHQLHAEHPNVAVLLTTGYSERRIDLRGIRTLPKPYSTDDAAEALLDALAEVR